MDRQSVCLNERSQGEANGVFTLMISEESIQWVKMSRAEIGSRYLLILIVFSYQRFDFSCDLKKISQAARFFIAY